MTAFSWHRLLLPLTIVAMFFVFTQKAIDMARAATGSAEVRSSAPLAKPAVLEPASGIPAAAAPPEASSAAEMALLADLRKRREAIDARATALDRRAELLAAAEIKLQNRLDELTRLQAHLEELEQRRRQRESANWNGLVKTYQDMKAGDAATIFNVLDIDVLLEVLDRMEERKAAPILAAMLPERARRATELLAKKRLDESAVKTQVAVSNPSDNQK